VCVVDRCKEIMQQRNVTCLDSYLDRVQVMLWTRLKTVLEANIQSLRRAQPAALGPPSVSTHLATRRYAELAASLSTLRKESRRLLQREDALSTALQQMHDATVDLLTKLSELLPGLNERCTFLINNYDLVLAVFNECQIGEDVVHRFDDLRKKASTAFVEHQLQSRFPQLVQFVKEKEGAAQVTPSPDVTKRMESIAQTFAQGWKGHLDQIHKDVLASFTNFRSGTEILKQTFTQLLLCYTQYQKICIKAFPSGPPFARDFVSNGNILNEIRKFSGTL